MSETKTSRAALQERWILTESNGHQLIAAQVQLCPLSKWMQAGWRTSREVLPPCADEVSGYGVSSTEGDNDE